MMGVRSEHGGISGDGSIPHPAIGIFEERISNYIGVLSKFIVRKQYSQFIENHEGPLNKDDLESFISTLLKEVDVLIGEKKTSELEEELREITTEFFKEGKGNEQ